MFVMQLWSRCIKNSKQKGCLRDFCMKKIDFLCKMMTVFLSFGLSGVLYAEEIWQKASPIEDIKEVVSTENPDWVFTGHYDFENDGNLDYLVVYASDKVDYYGQDFVEGRVYIKRDGEYFRSETEGKFIVAPHAVELRKMKYGPERRIFVSYVVKEEPVLFGQWFKNGKKIQNVSSESGIFGKGNLMSETDGDVVANKKSQKWKGNGVHIKNILQDYQHLTLDEARKEFLTSE